MKYIIFLAVITGLGLFIRTAPPTIYLGDSGEIAAAAYTLGIPHPPGYPLDMLLGKISMLVPLGDMAFRMNILSSLLAVICFVFLYLSGTVFLGLVFKGDAGKNSLKFASLFVSMMFLFSSMFWFEGIHAKGSVYVLAIMLMAITLFLALKNISTGKNKYLFAAAFAAGFLIPAHNSTSLFLLFTAAILLYVNRKALDYKKVSTVLILFLIPLLTAYIYLFIRAGSGTPVNFGYLKDAGDVVNHIMRKAYDKQYTAMFDMGAYFTKVGYYLAQFVEKYNILAVFFFAGIYPLYLFSRKAAIFALSFIVVNTALLIYVINTSAGFSINSLSSISLYASQNFYMMNDIIPVLLSMAGVYFFLKVITGKYGINIVFAGSVLSVALALVIAVNFGMNNFSRTFMAYDHGMNINKSLNKDDILWVRGDCPLFNVVYLQSVKSGFEGIRTYDRDANLLDRTVFEALKERPQSAISRVELNIFKDNINRVFYTSIADLPSERAFTLPHGIIFKMTPAGNTSIGTQPLSRLYSMRDYFNNDNQDLYYRDVSARYFVMRGRYAGLRGDRDEADKWLKLAFKTAGTSPEILNSIATVYYFSFGDKNTALDYERRIFELDPSDNTALTLIISIFKELNPIRAVEYLNIMMKRSTDATEKQNIKMEIDAINDAARNNKGNY